MLDNLLFTKINENHWKLPESQRIPASIKKVLQTKNLQVKIAKITKNGFCLTAKSNRILPS